MTIQEIAKECNVCAGTVYRIAKLLGRMPTVAEVNGRNKQKTGRKKKYI